MLERNALERALRSISRRMRLARALREASFAVAASAGVALLYQILASAMEGAGRSGAAVAACAAVAGVWVRALWRTTRAVGEDAAADRADERGDLHDLLKSARWFERVPGADALRDGVAARASRAAQALDARAVAPLVVPRSTPVALILLLAAVAWWIVQPDWLRHSVRAVGARAEGSAASAEPGRRGYSGERRKPAGSDAKSPDGGDAAAARAEGKADRSGVAAGSATQAASVGGTGGSAAPPIGASSEERMRKALAGADEGRPGNADSRDPDAPKGAAPVGSTEKRAEMAADDGVSLPAAKKLVATGALDLFSKIGEMFKGGDEEAAQPHGEVARALRQATLLGDRNQDDAGTPRQNSNAPKAKESDASPPGPAGPAVPLTPDSQRQAGHGDGSGDKPEGNARLDAGDIPQQPSATGEGEANRLGGNDNAESKGTGPAAPVKGEKTARLATQLSRSLIKSVASEGGREVGLDPIYAATRAQQSMLDYRTIAAKSPVGREEAMSGERVPLAWRPVVRDYFLAVKSRDKP